MKADNRFLSQPKHFWANVRSISEKVGYTERRTKQVKVPNLSEVARALRVQNLGNDHLISSDGAVTELGDTLLQYFQYRADILNEYVHPRLMNLVKAREVFTRLQQEYNPTCPIPMNKQKGKKSGPAYFTGIINILIEANIGDYNCNYDPQNLTTITLNNAPLRTLARRVDGAFPSTVNPIAVWEIKEYYYTTTFGSRVADGVYESLLDGLELEELQEQAGIEVKHYFMVDDLFTWWTKGRSYLCRIVDMLHMGLLDEALFGYEVVERIPEIAQDWVQIAKSRGDLQGQLTLL